MIVIPPGLLCDCDTSLGLSMIVTLSVASL